MIGLLNPTKKMYFLSSHSKSKIVEILRHKIDNPHFSVTRGGYSGFTEILGKIENNSFVIHKKRAYRQPAIPFLYGKIVEKDGKTLIICHFDYSATGKSMIFTVYLLSVILSIVISFFCLLNMISGKDSLLNLIYIAFIVLINVALLLGGYFAKKVSSDEILFFENFFKATLDTTKLDKTHSQMENCFASNQES